MPSTPVLVTWSLLAQCALVCGTLAGCSAEQSAGPPSRAIDDVPVIADEETEETLADTGVEPPFLDASVGLPDVAAAPEAAVPPVADANLTSIEPAPRGCSAARARAGASSWRSLGLGALVAFAAFGAANRRRPRPRWTATPICPTARRRRSPHAER